MMDIAGNPILTEDQRGLLFQFAKSTLCDRFYLTGGTAVAGARLEQTGPTNSLGHIPAEGKLVYKDGQFLL